LRIATLTALNCPELPRIFYEKRTNIDSHEFFVC
jgi:hypothetical protein